MGERFRLRSHIGPNPVLGYALAVAATGVALIARWALRSYLSDYVPFITLYPGVAFMAAFVGLGPAVVATVLGLAGITYWFVAPYYTLMLWKTPLHAAATVVYLLVCGLIITAGEINRRSKGKLSRANALFDAFTENSPGTVFLKDESGRYLYVNKLSKSRFNDSMGKTDYEMFAPEYAKQYRDNDSLVLLENKPREFVETTREADGEHVWLSLKFPIVDSEGRSFLGGKSIDITDLKRAEQEVLRLQGENADRAAAELEAMRRLHEVGTICARPGNTFEQALNAILNAAIFVTHADKGNLQLLNGESGVLTIAAQNGFEEEFLSFFASVGDETSACGSAMRATERVVVEDVTQSEVFAGQPSQEILLRAGVRAVQSTPLVSSSGKVLGMISTHYSAPRRSNERELRLLDLLARQAADYLERKQGEEALRKATDQLQSFLDAAATGLTRCSRDLRYLSANPAYGSFVGLPVEQIVGRRLIDVMGAKGFALIRPYVERVLCGERVEFETGSPFSVSPGKQLHVVYTPERDGDDVVVGWLASITDITELKFNEQRLQKLERLAAAGQLAASLAHELNNPLAAVINVVYLLQRQEELGEKSREMATLASGELERVARIVRQNLSYYRVGTTPRRVDLALKLEDSLQIFSEKLNRAGIQVKKKIKSPAHVTGFPDEIRQVIDNLLLNSIEATPKGGRLVVSLRASRDWSDSSRPGLRLTVADTGTGIAREHVPQLFEPFFTTKAEKGTGLGLWVVRGIVAKHDGAIKLRTTHSHEKSGTVVSILWPFASHDRSVPVLAHSETASHL